MLYRWPQTGDPLNTVGFRGVMEDRFTQTEKPVTPFFVLALETT